MSHLTKNLKTSLRLLSEAKHKNDEAQKDLVVAYRFCMVFFNLGVISNDQMNEINHKINKHVSDLPFPSF